MSTLEKSLVKGDPSRAPVKLRKTLSRLGCGAFKLLADTTQTTADHDKKPKHKKMELLMHTH